MGIFDFWLQIECSQCGTRQIKSGEEGKLRMFISLASSFGLAMSLDKVLLPSSWPSVCDFLFQIPIVSSASFYLGFKDTAPAANTSSCTFHCVPVSLPIPLGLVPFIQIKFFTC